MIAAALGGGAPAGTWTVAQGEVDVDGDGVKDRIRVEAADTVHHVDEDPCAGCGDHMYGHFEAVVALSASGRVVRTPVYLHQPGEELHFDNRPVSDLALADYNADGRPDFNLGQFTNSNKWEYGLFTVHPDGRVERFGADKPEIYVSPGGEPSSKRIEVIPGGFRFRDYGNAPPGWLTTTCLWDAGPKEFRCSGEFVPFR